MVDDKWGRALRDWILFAIGVAMLVAFLGKWVVNGEAPDVTLSGIALILVGIGNEVLKRGAG
jgi:hypothetical protein